MLSGFEIDSEFPFTLAAGEGLPPSAIDRAAEDDDEGDDVDDEVEEVATVVAVMAVVLSVVLEAIVDVFSGGGEMRASRS